MPFVVVDWTNFKTEYFLLCSNDSSDMLQLKSVTLCVGVLWFAIKSKWWQYEIVYGSIPFIYLFIYLFIHLLRLHTRQMLSDHFRAYSYLLVRIWLANLKIYTEWPLYNLKLEPKYKYFLSTCHAHTYDEKNLLCYVYQLRKIKQMISWRTWNRLQNDIDFDNTPFFTMHC